MFLFYLLSTSMTCRTVNIVEAEEIDMRFFWNAKRGGYT